MGKTALPLALAYNDIGTRDQPRMEARRILAVYSDDHARIRVVRLLVNPGLVLVGTAIFAKGTMLPR